MDDRYVLQWAIPSSYGLYKWEDKDQPVHLGGYPILRQTLFLICLGQIWIDQTSSSRRRFLNLNLLEKYRVKCCNNTFRLVCLKGQSAMAKTLYIYIYYSITIRIIYHKCLFIPFWSKLDACVCMCARLLVKVATNISLPHHSLFIFFLSQAAAKGTEMDENGRLTFYIHNDAATSWALHCAQCRARTTSSRYKGHQHHFSLGSL